jgi:hypothetical protein
MTTGSFTVLEKDPMFSQISVLDKWVKVYDSTGALRCWGPLTTADEQGLPDGQVKIVCTFVSKIFELSRRYVSYLQTPVASQDVADVAFALLARANVFRNTGISAGVNEGPYFNVGSVFQYKDVNVLNTISELSAMTGSFEWRLVQSDGSPPSSALWLEDSVGSDRTASVFLEHGWGKRNVTSYTYKTDGSQVIVTAGAGLTTYGMRLEPEPIYGSGSSGIIPGGAQQLSFQNRVSGLAAAYRAVPRRLLNVIMAPNSLIYGTNYTEGDFVTSRVFRAGSNRASGTQRIWSVTVTIDDNGREIASLVMQP